MWRCSDFNCPTFINIDEDDVTPRAPVAGESAQAQFERERAAHTDRVRRLATIVVGLGGLVSLGGFFLGAFIDIRIGAVIGFLVVVGFTWAWFNVLPDEVVNWSKGAESERRVGAQLDSLASSGFVTLYDRRIVGRWSNLDAVTVGPPGVFVVETKHRGRGVEVIQGRFEVGGREQPSVVRQVTEQAMLIQVSIAQAMNRHRLTVVPIICIGNRTVSGGETSGGVLVLDVKSIAKRLAAEPPILSSAEVQELARLLDQALPAFERRRD